jgi:lipopolysaccharide biosynthesis glycosyltransferase
MGRIADLIVVHENLTSLIYGRLLIPDIVPLSVQKVLYLDCDLVVRGDVAELWDTDLGDKSIFAVRDRIGFVSSSSGLVNYRELGIPADAKYFNSGVLLINLNKWREKQTGMRVFEYVRTHRDIIQMEDQEGLNALLFADWGELDFRWNWQIPWRNYRLGRATVPWVPQTDVKSIVHFATSEKPWLPGCDYAEKSIFFEYLDRTPWEGWRVSWTKEVVTRVKRALREAQRRTQAASQADRAPRPRTSPLA